ncbi:MAG: HK97 family phage prohead protease, partial [Candidatus Shapirobacteria bacterium]
KAVRTEIVGKGKRSKLEQDWEFAVNENPKAKIIFDLYAGEFLRASSVGFIPRKFKENQDGTRDWFTIEEAELLEVSAVSVPANAMALAKSKGINIDALELAYDDEPEGDDETPENHEIPTDDGAAAAENDEGGEGGGDGGDEDAGEDPGDEGGEGDGGEDEPEGGADKDGSDEDVTDTDEPAETDAAPVAPPPKSYRSRIAEALTRIETKEKEGLRRAARIIQRLAEDSSNHPKLDAKTNEQIRKRKVNQVIRSLLKVK